MIIDDCVVVFVLVFQLIEPFMDVLLVPLALFGIDFRRKGHGLSVLFFNPLLESGGFLIDFGKMLVLTIQKLLQIACASALATIDVGLEGAIRHGSAFELNFELIDLVLLVDDVLRCFIEILLRVSLRSDVAGGLFLSQIGLEFD